MPQSQSDTKENNFTFLRLLAACMVIFGHSFALKKMSEPLGNSIRFECTHGLAVTTFFVISGFLVTTSIMRSHSIAGYMKKRCLRIMPALMVTVLITVFVIGPVMTTLNTAGYFSQGRTWAYLQSILIYPLKYDLPGVFKDNPHGGFVNGSLGTLPIEFSAYLLLIPILFLKFRPRIVISTALLFMLLSLVLIPFFHMDNVKIFHMSLSKFSKCLSFFSFGSLLYSARGKIKFTYLNYSIAWAALIAGALTPYPQFFYYLTWPYIVICTAFMPLPFVGRLEKLGDISYGVYLYAYPVQQSILYMYGGDISPYRLMAYTFPVAFLCGILSWKMVERPALGFKNRPIFGYFQKPGISVAADKALPDANL